MPDELFLPNLAVPSKSSNHLIEVDKVMTPLPLEIMRIFDLVYSSFIEAGDPGNLQVASSELSPLLLQRSDSNPK